MTQKATKRLYINVTDRCNTNCPFCCMYSGTDNKLDMSFDTYKNIVDNTGDEFFELQLEGGEPLIFPKLYLFIEYAIATGRCSKVIVLTNGIELEKHLHRLVELHKWYSVEFMLKVSVNYHLLKAVPDHLKTIADLVFATELLPRFNITLNTRKRHNDAWIDDEIDSFGLSSINHSFELQSYGRMTGSNYDTTAVNVEKMEYCQTNKVRLNDIWEQFDGRTDFIPWLNILGYYYYVEIYKYGNAVVASESANLNQQTVEVAAHPNMVYEMVFHTNGNLCASWIDKERILDKYGE